MSFLEVTDVVTGELRGLGFSRNLWESLATEPPPRGPRDFQFGLSVH